MKSIKPDRIQEAKFNESLLYGQNKKVLLDYQVPTRPEEIEKLAEAVRSSS